MQWLDTIVAKLMETHTGGAEIVVSSGVSPSGTYHLGTLREVLTAEIIAVEVRRRGGKARHLHVVDDLDVLRKIPADVSNDWEKYLGYPLCDVPAPDGSDRSYADYFLQDLLDAAQKMELSMEVMRAHERYRAGAYVSVIEEALGDVPTIRRVIEEISGRALDEQWTPIQIVEDNYIKNRPFVAIDSEAKTVRYIGADGGEKQANYATGEVKLSWRVDWPARWKLLNVAAEPFGRDHATKGGSYDTGVEIARQVFDTEAPLPIPYHFINRVGETKKMSKSAGNVITATQLLEILPPEIIWFFLLHSSPDKQLFFGEGETLLRLFDDFAVLLEKADKEPWEQQLIELCLHNVSERTVSNVPFSHLVASYQAALKSPERTLEIIERTEHAQAVTEQCDIIIRELRYIDSWLENWAPEELKFSLQDTMDFTQFSDAEKSYFSQLADSIERLPAQADGEAFHQAIYDFKENVELAPRELFSSLYRVTIGKTSGPRAGWFLSILPREWLIARLRGNGMV